MLQSLTRPVVRAHRDSVWGSNVDVKMMVKVVCIQCERESTGFNTSVHPAGLFMTLTHTHTHNHKTWLHINTLPMTGAEWLTEVVQA